MVPTRIISVRLTPKASTDHVGNTRILPNGDEQLMMYVTAPPDDNKANEALLRLLARHLGVAVSRLTIIQGQKNRNKLVRIE